MDRIKEIEERVKAATPGPWDRTTACTVRAIKDDLAVPLFESCVPYEWHRKVYTTAKVMADAHRDEVNNAEFVAHAREDVPWLLSHLSAVTAERDRIATDNSQRLLEVVRDRDQLRKALEKQLCLLRGMDDKNTGEDRCVTSYSLIRSMMRSIAETLAAAAKVQP
jgi:hypothetical protein